jgi:hypothetical protein
LTASSTRPCTVFIAGLQSIGLGGELLRELVGDRPFDEHLSCGHADLPLVEERAEGRRVHRVLEVGVRKDDDRVVAAELEHDPLQVPAGRLGELATDVRGAGEVDSAHRRMRDELVADVAGLARRVRDDVEHSLRQARLREDLPPHEPARPRRPLRRLEHDRVAERKRRRDRARREDERGVPRRDRADDAHGLADPHREGPGVRRDDLSDRLIRGCGRLPEEPWHEMHLEHPEAEGGARLASEHRDDLVLAGFEDVGRLQEDRLPRGGRRRCPGREGRSRRLDRLARVVAVAGWNDRDGLARERILVFEGLPACGGRPLPADELLVFAYCVCCGRHLGAPPSFS